MRMWTKLSPHLDIILLRMQFLLVRRIDESTVADPQLRVKYGKAQDKFARIMALSDKEVEKFRNDLNLALEKELWPIVDYRWDLEHKGIVQVVLKPILPGSAREYLYNIIIEEAKNIAGGINFMIGGCTSIDAIRVDTHKGSAIVDLLTEAKCIQQPELLLFLDDEMGPKGVGFSGLTVNRITAVSIENTEDGKKRIYLSGERERIKASLWWSKEIGWGTEIEATENIYRAIIEFYKKEVFKIFEHKPVRPAILVLREMMENNADGGSRYSDAGKLLFKTESAIKDIKRGLADSPDENDMREVTEKMLILSVRINVFHSDGQIPEDYKTEFDRVFAEKHALAEDIAASLMKNGFKNIIADLVK